MDIAVKAELQDVALKLTSIVGDVMEEIKKVRGSLPAKLVNLAYPQPTSIRKAVWQRKHRTAEIATRKCFKLLREVRYEIVGTDDGSTRRQEDNLSGLLG